MIAFATAFPFSEFRPQVTNPAVPASAKRRAMAAPSPCVPPVTTAYFPSNRFNSYLRPTTNISITIRIETDVAQAVSDAFELLHC